MFSHYLRSKYKTPGSFISHKAAPTSLFYKTAPALSTPTCLKPRLCVVVYSLQANANITLITLLGLLNTAMAALLI